MIHSSILCVERNGPKPFDIWKDECWCFEIMCTLYTKKLKCWQFWKKNKTKEKEILLRPLLFDFFLSLYNYLIIAHPSRSMIYPAILALICRDIGRFPATSEIPHITFLTLLAFLHEPVSVKFRNLTFLDPRQSMEAVQVLTNNVLHIPLFQ